MAVSGDVTITQNGGQGNVKLHPYLVAWVRWCMSCLWSTATVVLHRLMTTPLPPLSASKPLPKLRTAGTEHLHPEPRVECVVLHTPLDPKIDVIFVHGLYGSLGNTWRQGDWRPKYKIEPNKVPLLEPQVSCNCKTDINEDCNKNDKTYNVDEMSNVDEHTYNDEYYEQTKILTNEQVFITEKFYHETILDQVEIVDNYEIQANFVRDLFEKECNECAEREFKLNNKANKETHCECKLRNIENCDVGCGCVCDDCYSHCWPKDWIKADYPDARVISINYTSDPHLWRPLWVKGYKRLRLHERAEQMTKQLLNMGVGQRPIIWVGHSKGGLFIKQIYCEAYEAYLKRQNDETFKNINLCDKETNNFKDFGNNSTEKVENNTKKQENNIIENNMGKYVNCNEICDEKVIKSNNCSENKLVNDNKISNSVAILVNNNLYENNIEIKKDFSENDFVRNSSESNTRNETGTIECEIESSSNTDEDLELPAAFRASLWMNSVGFMFYSVPHRGSPLADFKMPITARSIELLEISKDCALVLSLHERWLRAAASIQPAVRSLVETTRTLMSVLWLRIVSETSADAGIGALYGISVDHREICKPTSRRCLLYTELMTLMHSALNKCRCNDC